MNLWDLPDKMGMRLGCVKTSDFFRYRIVQRSGAEENLKRDLIDCLLYCFHLCRLQGWSMSECSFSAEILTDSDKYRNLKTCAWDGGGD